MIKDYKIVYHLVGEQALPVYITAIQFSKDALHYLLTTDAKKTRGPAENVKKTLEKHGIQSEIQILGAENAAVSFPQLQSMITQILTETRKENIPAAFDVTGGTKPMSMTSLMVGSNRNIDFFYLNTAGRELTCLTDHTLTMQLEKCLEMEDFFTLAGMNLEKYSTESCSRDVLEFFMKKSQVLQRYQGDFALCLPGKKKNKSVNKETHFHETFKKMTQSWDQNNWKGIWDKVCEQKGKSFTWQMQAAFFAGGWFEDYVYSRILQIKNPKVKQVWFNAVLSFPGDHQSAQEFDVVYTDGYSLIILECKAGKIIQEYIQKLENLRGHFSGALGKCALVSLNGSRTENNRQEAFVSRIKKSGSIAAFCTEKGVKQLTLQLLTFSSGQIYE